MAIQDRNLCVGTKLYARYKGQTYTAEVIETKVLPAGMLPKDAPADPDPRLVAEIRYRLTLPGWSEPQDFKSPSAAGTKVTGKSCNGWAFWSVGDGGENTGPVTSTTTRAPRPKAQPAPKPQPKRRGRKSQSEEPPATDAEPEPHTNGSDLGNPGDVHPEGIVCHACGETFPSVEAATEHYYSTHGKPEGDEPTA